MFARHVTLQLKRNSAAEAIQTLEKEVLPLLRKQKGFRDKITLLAPGGREAVGISLWDQKRERGCIRTQRLRRSCKNDGEGDRGNASGQDL
jgi:hypothetical protein